ncbi:MAG: PEP-utilizing enzyme, partial [Desulfobacterales bacterium]|nr:PEP-utilizing enzyme [Desulfobacterales bacterium]
VVDAYKEVLAGKYSVTAIQYRLNRGFRDEDVDMSVGCIAMVDAVSGGVVYTRHPFDVRDDAVYIQSTWGLPKAVVDGSVNCDLFVVSRGESPRVLRQDVQIKEKKFICYADEGECRMDFVDEMQSAPSLTEDLMIRIARYAQQIEDHYGTPQDIEWAVLADDGTDGDTGSRIVLLQSRPLKQVRVKTNRESFPEHDTHTALAAGGITASPGAAAGPVYIVTDDADLTRFPKGAVLVAKRALPKWAPLLGRASALVTEKGSFAGHLANVAREFGVPAVFGIEDACGSLPPDRLITVDADNCRLYPGQVDSLLKSQGPDKNLMAGSPVHRTLTEISRHILPLNLLDPDSPGFVPKNCRT